MTITTTYSVAPGTTPSYYKKGRNNNIEGANLITAHLEDANLLGTNIITFQFKKHFAFYFEGLLRIGCLYNDIQYWFKNYEKIGRKNDYSNEEIETYGDFIRLCHKRWVITKKIP